jgi:hypothetical protein
MKPVAMHPALAEFLNEWRTFGLSVRLPAFAPDSLYEYLIAGWIDAPPVQGETLCSTFEIPRL